MAIQNDRTGTPLAVGVDIGSSRTKVVVAEMRPGMLPEVKAIGEAVNEGMVRGEITSVDACVESINKAVTDAQQVAGCRISQIITNIGGAHIAGQMSDGLVVARNGRSITAADIDDVLRVARAIPAGQAHYLLHAEPQWYELDGHRVQNPQGMVGVRLKCLAHLVMCDEWQVRSMLSCLRRCGLEVSDNPIPNAVASAAFCLHEHESSNGVLLIDMGAGTTDIAVYAGKILHYVESIPEAGDYITHQVARNLRTSTDEAEYLKRAYGCALEARVNPNELLPVSDSRVAGYEPAATNARYILAYIIELCLRQTLNRVKDRVADTGLLNQLVRSVVITGGGAAVPYIQELCTQVFDLPVRVVTERDSVYQEGFRYERISQPDMSTAMGLIHIVNQQVQKGFIQNGRSTTSPRLEWLAAWIRSIVEKL